MKWLDNALSYLMGGAMLILILGVQILFFAAPLVVAVLIVLWILGEL